MSDVNDFLNSYQETLDHVIQTIDWPEEILATYSFDSCLKHNPGKEVYLVTDKRTSGKAILRVTSHESGDRADTEWEILSKLNHPGIPKTYGRLTCGSKSYVVREFIPGHSIDVVVAQKPFSPQDIFSFAQKLCDILDYQHRQKPPVIHRDIKPQNVILRPDDSIVLTDFGIARVFKPEADSDTQYVGTLPYAPPEQYGYAQSTPQTDIYALGILLVYLATGSPNRQNLSEKIHDKKLLALIKRCIAFDPANRFSSVEDIRRFINKRYSSRSRFVAMISAGLALVLLVVGLIALFDPLGRIASLGNQEQVPGNDASNSQVNNQSESQDSSTPTGEITGTAVPQNSNGALFDSTTAGNLMGNTVNGGFVVEGDEETFIALSDGIYVIEPDGTLGRQVVNCQEPRYLNFYKGRLYFSSTSSGLMSANPQTGEITELYFVFTQKIYIDGEILYFENGEDKLNLYSIGLDGSNLNKVSDYNSVYYRNVVGGYQYFSNTNDGETLYRVNLTTGEEKLLYDARCAWVSIYDTTIYFSDFSFPGPLMSMNLNGENQKELRSQSPSYVNATPLGIFYVNPEAQQLETMSLDGKDRTVLTEKKCGGFCVTRDWIIYKNKNDDDKFWLMRIDGSDDHPLQK